MRRRARFDASLADLAERLEATSRRPRGDRGVEDDRLRLIFTCCHPAFAPEAQVALTLREVCGLTTEAIASAFLTAPSTLAQRIVRAKAKIRDARIPYQVPSREDLPERLDTVLQVIYLVFNEGYAASSGESLTRPDLSGEAIRLGRLLIELLPDAGSDRPARADAAARIAARRPHVADAARSSCSTIRTARSGIQHQIAEGKSLVDQALSSQVSAPIRCRPQSRPFTPMRPIAADTDWAQIVGLYDVLSQVLTVADRRAESRGRRGDARRPAGWSRLNRRHLRPRRFGRLPPGPCGPRRFVPAARTPPRPGPRTSRPWPSPGRSRNGDFSRVGWLNWAEKIFFWRLSISVWRRTTT